MSDQKDQGEALDRVHELMLTTDRCNGKIQCNRCGQDDAICVYTKRKRPNDKAYSKEYVQLLEEQQDLLIHAVKELYRRSRAGLPLPELHESIGDQSLIHEILASLDMIDDDREDSDRDTKSAACIEQTSRRSSTSDVSLQISHSTEMTMPPLSSSPVSTPSTLSPSVSLARDFSMPLELFHPPEYSSLPYFSDSTPKAHEGVITQELSPYTYMSVRSTGTPVMPSRSMPLCIDPRRTSYSNVPPTIHHAYTM